MCRSTFFTAERAVHARAVAEAGGRQIGGPIAAKTGIPKTSPHRYLSVEAAR